VPALSVHHLHINRVSIAGLCFELEVAQGISIRIKGIGQFFVLVVVVVLIFIKPKTPTRRRTVAIGRWSGTLSQVIKVKCG